MENPVISREYVEKNYIHKDKIRELLDKYGGSHFIAKVDVKKLLEETEDVNK